MACVRKSAVLESQRYVVGVAQWQSIALWMRGLWVRAPSPTQERDHKRLIRGVFIFCEGCPHRGDSWVRAPSPTLNSHPAGKLFYIAVAGLNPVIPSIYCNSLENTAFNSVKSKPESSFFRLASINAKYIFLAIS